MKILPVFFSALFFHSCLASASAELPLIPRPSTVETHEGQLTIGARIVVRVDPSDPAALRVAHALSDMLARLGGPSLTVGEGSPAQGRAAMEQTVIVISRRADAPVTQSEGYTLDVTAKAARIIARDESGLYYGAVSLAQLVSANATDKTFHVPAVHIADWPRFAWRGLMIDSARHMQSVAEIEGILEQMALHKLNVLHWHLTDDQGWRIEIKRYPELTHTGAWRTPPDAGKDGEPARYGGYYSQDDIRHVVAYAAARHITVVPELDMPGHAQAAVAAYPQFGVTGQRPAVSADWGVNPYLYNVDEPTLHFLEGVLDEVMALFPSRYIHLGGDEAIKDQWEASPAVQQRMRALGLQHPEQLQSWLMGRLGHYLDNHGRRLIGWDEILEGGVPGDAAVMSWRGIKGIEQATRAGHDVVVAPDPFLYLDYVQSTRNDETAGRLPMQSLQSVYAFEIVPPELADTQVRRILGAQANVWTEHMPTAAHLQHAIFPRLDALAENVWTPADKRNWQSFLARLPAQLARYRQQGIGYADSAYAVDIGVDRRQALASSKATVTLSNQIGSGVIHYTLDGPPPDTHSPVYTKPFTATLPVTIRAATLTTSGSLLANTRERVLDEAHLRSLEGNELTACPSEHIDEMRAQPTPDATSLTPTYTINVFDSCRLTPPLPLDGAAVVNIDLARLPRNVALAHDAKLITSRATATKHGELELRADRCDGPALSVTNLPDPTSSPARFTLTAALPPMHGTHSLCLVMTGSPQAPYYGVGRLQWQPAAASLKKPRP
ncbi:family 20 glycosylhydrolase [Dyella sp. OK004]|uniref:family 20 glycosylhydrolase n=1 Tax=Dyella sp. OK004 TaxID=1855292 RepID=UPI002101CDB1|nr:family 20 glycosylhydrolase [Dyella sp. OK004]